MPALTAPGWTSRGSWSCRSSGHRLHLCNPTQGLEQPPKGPVLKKEREAEEKRDPWFSSGVCYQVLFQCIFHPQSSQSLVEISAFAVAELGQIAQPCGTLSHGPHKPEASFKRQWHFYFISRPSFSAPIFKRLFLLLPTKMYGETPNPFFSLFVLKSRLTESGKADSLSLQIVPVHVHLFVFVFIY